MSVDLALDDFETLGARANLAQYIITLEPYGTADIFIDNLYFYGDNGQSTDAQDNNGNNDASNGNDADSATDYDNLVLVWSDEFDYSEDQIHQNGTIKPCLQRWKLVQW